MTVRTDMAQYCMRTTAWADRSKGRLGNVNDDQVRAAEAAIERSIPRDAIVGIYLYGSAVAGGLRPDSDLDLVVVTSRRLIARERTALIDAIRPLSRRSLRPPDWRPLELTVLALPDVRPWRYPPHFDMQYGEWLTDTELDEQARGSTVASPDLAVAMTMLRQASHACIGPPVADVLDPVPRDDLVRATLDAIPALLADLEGDTRNVLLTLTRMWTTMATGTIRTKDDAAEWAAERLPPGDQGLLDRARTLYLEGGWGEWDATMAHVRLLAHRMWNEIRGEAR
jgi:predicted nucleotidyltransferase